jgi:tRNA (guanine-N(7)-)-methyltransferase subunit TRM82
MPKRPSSIAITPDDKTIIVADKFGDVYAVPLIPTTKDLPPGTQYFSSPAAAALSKIQLTQRASGSNLTVHTGINQRSLQTRLQQLERKRQESLSADGSEISVSVKPDEEASVPNFEHTLLLGHVSMVTALTLASAPSAIDSVVRRPYIITGDRDEHVRVSRGQPQTHVIESFCLGHDEFVSGLCVPATVHDGSVLISGGGDPELHAWDWKQGKLLGKADLLGPVKEYEPGAEQVALTRLIEVPSHGSQGSVDIVAICEQ